VTNSVTGLAHDAGAVLADLVECLDAQRQLFSSEIELARTTRDQLTAVVQLYKALGGGWTEAEPSAAAR